MTPQELSDQLEITRLLQRYFQAIDEKDYALLDRVFTPDADCRYDIEGGGAFPYAVMRERFEATLPYFRFTQHLMGTPTIEVGGDAARSRASLRAVHTQLATDGRESTWVVYGFYLDRHVRTAQGWRIRERFFKAQHQEGQLLPFSDAVRFPEPAWRAEVAAHGGLP